MKKSKNKIKKSYSWLVKNKDNKTLGYLHIEIEAYWADEKARRKIHRTVEDIKNIIGYH